MAASYRQTPPEYIQSLILCLLIILTSQPLPSVVADPPYKICSDTGNSATNTTAFQDNLNTLLSYMSLNASASNFYNTSFGNGTSGRLYAQYMCLNYVTNETCGRCIEMASQGVVQLCPNDAEAIVWEEVCQLRYSVRDFFGTLDVSGNQCYFNMKNISRPEKFKVLVNSTLQNLTEVAASGPEKYATGEVKYKDSRVNDNLNVLVQCARDMSDGKCRACLRQAIKDVLSNASFSIGARVLSRSCYLRYEFYSFYNGANNTDPAGASGGGKKIPLILILPITLAAAVLVLVLVGSLIYYSRKFQSRNARNRDYPFISLRTIISATKNFSSSNKLGQGGFGPVYKGVLDDGKEVAIKMLSSCSDQGAEEFTNEVLLIMNLQHNNLVKLLGFCADRDEKMLVYEFMPNSSLDLVLFDPKKRAKLGWSRRVDIINGIARGILYLHEDSPLKIIHRDLKPSNILLDSEMNAKISDFGMARIFAGDDGSANTARIVGTYGYMAPEYAMEGLYSTKSDVFSFGVILLEIITGERNVVFHLSKRAPTLPAYAWKLWNEGKGLELVDPVLLRERDSSWSPEEFARYMNVGLLCVQEDAYDRPSMSSVIVMLKSESTALRKPERPAFSVGQLKDHQDNNCSCSVNGASVSNVLPR